MYIESFSNVLRGIAGALLAARANETPDTAPSYASVRSGLMAVERE
jgi:hypothetical protein